jgi:hypothetical protein
MIPLPFPRKTQRGEINQQSYVPTFPQKFPVSHTNNNNKHAHGQDMPGPGPGDMSLRIAVQDGSTYIFFVPVALFCFLSLFFLRAHEGDSETRAHGPGVKKVKRGRVALVGLEEMNDEPCVRCAVAVSRAAKVSGDGEGRVFCESLFRVRGKGLRGGADESMFLPPLPQGFRRSNEWDTLAKSHSSPHGSVTCPQ